MFSHALTMTYSKRVCRVQRLWGSEIPQRLTYNSIKERSTYWFVHSLTACISVHQSQSPCIKYCEGGMDFIIVYNALRMARRWTRRSVLDNAGQRWQHTRITSIVLMISILLLIFSSLIIGATCNISQHKMLDLCVSLLVVQDPFRC